MRLSERGAERGHHRASARDVVGRTMGPGPSSALAVLFCALLFVFPSEVVLAGPLRSNGSPIRLLGFAALLLLLLGLLRARPPEHGHRRVDPVLVVLVLYAAQSLFSYGVSTGRNLTTTDAATSLRYFLVLLAGCAIAMLIAVSVPDLAAVRRLLGWLLAGSALNAAVGLAQATGADFVWAEVIRLPGLAFTSNPGVLRDRLDFVRVLGTTSHPIEFAVCLAVTLPLAIHMAVFAGTRVRRVSSMAVAALIAMATPFALSRSGLLCIAVGMLVYLCLATRAQRWAVAVGLVLAPAVAVLLVPRVVDAFVVLFRGVSVTSTDDDSIAGRLDDYADVMEVFDRSPLLGETLTSADGYLDNQWLGFLVSGGLVAVVGFAALLVVPAVLNGLAARARPRSPERSSLAGALSGGLAASGVAAYTFDTLAFQQSAMLVFVLVGMSSVVVRSTWWPEVPGSPTSLPPLVSPYESARR